MENKEIINYFNSNYLVIFNHKSNNLISFINECSDNNRLTKIMTEWPDEIKILIVKAYLSEVQ